MFQLSAFSTLQSWAQRYLDARIKKQATDGDGATQSEKGLNKKRTLIAEIDERLKELRIEEQKVNDEDESLKSEEIKLRNASDAAIKQRDKFRVRQDQAKDAKKDAEIRLDGLRRNLLQSLRDPHQLSPAFAKAMIEIREGFDQVKLPEKSSREWFRELAEQAENCICGRPLEDSHREHIRRESERYLGSDDVILLDRIKQAVAQKTGGEYEESDRELNAIVDQVGDAFDAVGLAEATYHRIVEEAAQEDPEVKRTELRLKEIYGLRAELAVKRNRFERPNQGDRPRNWTNVIETEKELQRQRSILEKQTDTVVLSDKRKRLHDLLDEIRIQGRAKLGETLATRVNSTLEELMPDNRVRLGSVGRSLRLRERGGASIGETLTVAYAFLTRLGHSSSYSLPLVIDTPAAPIDEHIRGEIGLSLPRLVRQFIAFTISPERGAFVEALTKGSEGDVQFLTLFRSSNTRLMKELQSAKLPKGDVAETIDARLVTGFKFFNSFQDDSNYERHDAV
jgi:hypothetical protein